jgi:hypothetical protein
MTPAPTTRIFMGTHSPDHEAHRDSDPSRWRGRRGSGAALSWVGPRPASKSAAECVAIREREPTTLQSLAFGASPDRPRTNRRSHSGRRSLRRLQKRKFGGYRTIPESTSLRRGHATSSNVGFGSLGCQEGPGCSRCSRKLLRCRDRLAGEPSSARCRRSYPSYFARRSCPVSRTDLRFIAKYVQPHSAPP